MKACLVSDENIEKIKKQERERILKEIKILEDFINSWGFFHSDKYENLTYIKKNFKSNITEFGRGYEKAMEDIHKKLKEIKNNLVEPKNLEELKNEFISNESFDRTFPKSSKEGD